MRRRSILGAPIAASFAPQQLAAAATESRVYAMGDGIPYSPTEYAHLLAKVSDVEADDFSRGGVVEKL